MLFSKLLVLARDGSPHPERPKCLRSPAFLGRAGEIYMQDGLPLFRCLQLFNNTKPPLGLSLPVFLPYEEI